MVDVTLVCGDETYRWPEAPARFLTWCGRRTVEWQRRGLMHVDEAGHRYYRYDLLIPGAASHDDRRDG